ncbi:hypothetical protein HYE82_04025 [Streptomyces sp. BR123]|uniref:hypothetical protein n=1 Tax=Streptomyces sp. BR123 TaxID=2749828 RepID=UPI0015C44122|nr:hypothetical protein [Streptomyces sp. BR123]NXY93587.1 hypothetical protein [Streptomyces sp. BR123]
MSHAAEGAGHAAALDALRTAGRRSRGPRAGSPLVDALIGGNGLQAVRQAAADGHADERRWLDPADRIRDRQPAGALTVCLRWIEPLRRQTGDRACERLGELLLSARARHRAPDTATAFAACLTAALRADRKRKRKLMALLDRHGALIAPSVGLSGCDAARPGRGCPMPMARRG